ncbi:uncharacterized protein K452DRAFT_356931 [Aplosporella prunicola CBS 121167]|uniref:Ubiquitin 3 binding protein But2 C-terminal domain-containing protein n=1 Tax=Aplosporella prunicola CBS 121167 TaxID=1176127 RepID=A0A6A6BIK6_9PEZI|nr:uncharacterized protein K452DRAFT_356931 [Aplosporella prunicola CBS 121167]KAF2143959.1 hypothetical protein K452DRAFT_356931 [Aplosporella prunicola CBS 121167]
MSSFKHGSILSFLFFFLALCSALVESRESVDTSAQATGNDEPLSATKETHNTHLSTPQENLLPSAVNVGDSSTSISADAEDSDPNESQQVFGSILMHGPENDVQSFDPNDGSHLALFDCPNTAPSDFSIQSLKAVCMRPDEGSNCEKIMSGGVEGTVVRLPPDCGPDTYVRAVSFEALETLPPSLPERLRRKMREESRVYELRYDYNFQKLREDAGTVDFQIDFSNIMGF